MNLFNIIEQDLQCCTELIKNVTEQWLNQDQTRNVNTGNIGTHDDIVEGLDVSRRDDSGRDIISQTWWESNAAIIGMPLSQMIWVFHKFSVPIFGLLFLLFPLFVIIGALVGAITLLPLLLPFLLMLLLNGLAVVLSCVMLPPLLFLLLVLVVPVIVLRSDVPQLRSLERFLSPSPP